MVYVDNDPMVLAHARALLTSTPEGATAYVDASFLEPDTILASAELRDTLDLTKPVALSLVALLHFMPDDVKPQQVVARLLDALPPGSYLNLTNATGDFAPEETSQAEQIYRQRGVVLRTRTLAEVTSFFDGLELVDPGVTVVHRWNPDPELDGPDERTDTQVSLHGGVARKQ